MKKFLMFVSMLLLGYQVQGCSCVTLSATVCETVVEYEGYDFQVATVLAVKQADSLYGMTVQVLENYSEFAIEEQIVVWGDRGFDCRSYTEQFVDGDTMLLVLTQIEEVFDSTYAEQAGDYQLGICGVFVVPVEDGLVSGDLLSGVSTAIPIADIRNELESVECQMPVSTVDESPMPIMHLYPNPTNTTLHIGSSQHLTSLQIFDAAGRIIHEGSHTGVHVQSIDVAAYEAGIYIVRYVSATGTQQHYRRFVKL